MKITLITVCSALAAVSVAEAVPQYRRHDNRPRYYFPKVVKRQVDSPFGNSTTTTSATDPLGSLISSVGDTLSDVDDALNGETTTTDDATTTDSATSTTTDDKLLDPVGGIVSSVVADVTSVVTDLVSNVDSLVDSITATPTTQFTVGVDTVISGTEPTSTDGGLVPGVSSIASEVLDGASSAASSILDVASSLQSQVSTAVGSDLASISSALSSAQDVASSIASQVSSANSVLLPSASVTLPSITVSVDLPTITIPTVSIDPSISLDPTISISVSPPPIDTGSGTAPPPPIDTGSGTAPPPPSDTFTPPPETFTPPTDTFTPPPASDTFTPPPEEPTPAPFAPLANDTDTTAPPLRTSAEPTIRPTGTDTNTAFTPASSIATAATRPSASAPSSSASAIPTSLPRVITPEGGVPEQPDNSTLIQIGFLYGLNYEFVVNSSTAVAQIFTYLPMGVTGGLDIPKKEMVMQYLQPYNTLPTAGYITTLAMAYIPTEELDKLSVDLLNPMSSLYTEGSDSVKTLMAMVDPTVPLLAGSQLAGGTPINSADPSATGEGGGEGGSGFEDNSSGGPVNPSSVGIALGAVGGAVVYGAAMFLVARRYKKRKAAHQRSSSVQSGGRRAHENTNLMAGARNSYGSRFPQRGGSRNSDRSDDSGNSNRSGRTYISPPVMAENSLGWN
jgi:hypothetical protein